VGRSTRRPASRSTRLTASGTAFRSCNNKRGNIFTEKSGEQNWQHFGVGISFPQTTLIGQDLQSLVQTFKKNAIFSEKWQKSRDHNIDPYVQLPGVLPFIAPVDVLRGVLRRRVGEQVGREQHDHDGELSGQRGQSF
jgi:hypothetical protein